MLKLKEALKGRVCIIGIGNRLRGDDGFGSIVVERLKGKIDAVFFDAGTAPENFLGPITKAKPNSIIILDTADLGSSAGDIDILNKDDILKVGFSTHDTSPATFIKFLEKETGGDIFMIAVQPKNTGFGQELSKEVSERIENLQELLLSSMNR